VRQLECLLDQWGSPLFVGPQADSVAQVSLFPSLHPLVAVPLPATLDRGPGFTAPFREAPYEPAPREARASAAA